jgi:PAS domain S-box-containing protein
MLDKTATDAPLRILFVADLAADVELAERVFLKEGLAFTSMRVETRDALLQAFSEFRPDVVISGYALPELNGLQALSLTLAHDPGLPFILLTGSASEETAVACMKAGATDCLLKERVARLPFAVREALEKKRARMARKQAEDALLDSRNRFQALVETTVDFIWEMDTRGAYTYCSPQLETLWGLNPKEMIGKTPFDLLPPEDAEQALAGFRALLASASPFKDLQARSFDGAGQIRLLEINGVPFFDADGRLAGYRGTTRDVTQRKRAEEALARDRNLLRTLMDNLPDKVYIKDAESRYVLNNLAHMRSLGATQQEDVLGKISFDFFPQPLAAQYRADEQEVMRSGQPLVEREEIVVDLATGQPAWHLTTKVPLRDSQGKVVGLVGVSRNITERKRSEEEIQSLARFPSENPDPILRIARDGTLLYINQAGLILLPEWHLQVGQAAPSTLREAGLQSMDTETTQTLDLGHGERAYSFFVAPIVTAGYANLYGRDVTERKWAEEALRASEEKYRLLFDLESDALFLIERESGRILEASAGATTLYGYSHDEWLTMRNVDISAEPQGTRAATRDGATSIPLRWHRKKDGTVIPVDIRATQCEWQGRPAHLAAIRDITERERAEEALRKSEERFRSILDSIQDGYFEVDTAGYLTFFNPALVLILGRPSSELMGMNNRLYMTPECGKAVFRTFNRIFRTGIPEQAVGWAILRPDGTLRSVEASVSLIKAEDGSVKGFRGTVRDITERKHVEEALRQSEERFRAIASNSPDHILMQDRDLRYTLVVNPQFGLTEADMLGKTDTDIFPNEDGAKLTAIKRGVLDTAEPHHLVVSLKNPEGRQEFFDGSYVPKFDAMGKVDGLIGYFRNVTGQRHADEAERDQRRLAEALCETAAALNRSLDLDQVLDSILENAGRVMPHDAGEVLVLTSGGRVRDARHKGYEERGQEEWAKSRDFPLSDFPVLARIAETREPLVVSDKHGFPGWMNVPEASWFRSHVCAPVIGRDRVTGFVSLSSIRPGAYGLEHARRLGAFADQVAVALENASLFAQVGNGREQLRVLSRRLLEAQEVERRRVARELHDQVGQLLTGLKLSLQMTGAGASPKQKPGMEEAEALVGELMARVRQLSLDLRPAMLDDLGLLPALLWHLQRYSQQTHVAVDFKHAGIEAHRFSPEIETAAYRIVQEALTNVARHGGVAEATVRVWGDSEALTVQVEDRGAGFDEAELQANGKTSGLAGIRERVALLGGQITIEAAPGQGAHLTAVLPLAEPARKRPTRR